MKKRWMTISLLGIALASFTSCKVTEKPSVSSAISTIEDTSSSISSSSEESESSTISSNSTSSDSVISENQVLDYAEVSNKSWPSDTKTYRLPASKVSGDEFTVYNVKYDTEKYLKYPTTLTIKKTDYCLTYETVALYYQAFRCAPPNYFTKSQFKNMSSIDSSYRQISTYTYGSYTGSNGYTDALGTFNNKSNGKYLEFDIALSSSYKYTDRGAGRVVVVVDGITDYGSDPVCYFTLDHYSHFSEFYNYATGWGEKFLGAGQSTSQRKIPTTISAN